MTCFDCDEELSNYFNLGIHYERQHPGKPCRQKGQSLLNFSTGTKRKNEGEKVSESCSTSLTVLTHTSSLQSNNSETTSFSGDAETPFSPVNEESTIVSHVSTRTSDNLSSPNNNLHETQTLLYDNDLLQQMQSLLDALKLQSSDGNSSMEVAVKENVPSDTKSNLSNADEELVNRIQMSTSLKEIEAVLDDDFSVDRICDRLICNLCITDIENISSHKQSIPGLFTINDVENTKQKTQSRELRNLKTHLVSHIKTNIHQKNFEKQEEQKTASRKRIGRNREIGRKIGTMAYFFFYYKLPYRLFEKFLPILSFIDIDIGQVNHSEIFLRRLLDPCFEAIRRRL